MGRDFKFQVQDSFLEYIGRFEKRNTLSEKNPPLVLKNQLTNLGIFDATLYFVEK